MTVYSEDLTIDLRDWLAGEFDWLAEEEDELAYLAELILRFGTAAVDEATVAIKQTSDLGKYRRRCLRRGFDTMTHRFVPLPDEDSHD